MVDGESGFGRPDSEWCLVEVHWGIKPGGRRWSHVTGVGRLDRRSLRLRPLSFTELMDIGVGSHVSES